MNTKLVALVTFVIVVLGSLSGCIKVEFINPAEVEVQTPTETPAELVPTDEPLPTATAKPTVTAKSASTSKPLLTNNSEPIVTIIPVISLLHEQFNNTSSYYGYNTQLWDCWNCESIKKEDDVLQFNFQSSGNYSTLSSKATWSFSDIGLIQVRFRIVEAEGEVGGAPVAFIDLNKGPIESAWISQCIMGNYSYSYHFNCLVFTNGSGENYEYITDNIDIKPGEWYTAKMEINPLTKEITYSLNNAVIGRHIPEDKDSLISAPVWFNFGVGSGQWNDKIVAEFDDVLIAQFP